MYMDTQHVSIHFLYLQQVLDNGFVRYTTVGFGYCFDGISVTQDLGSIQHFYLIVYIEFSSLLCYSTDTCCCDIIVDNFACFIF